MIKKKQHADRSPATTLTQRMKKHLSWVALAVALPVAAIGPAASAATALIHGDTVSGAPSFEEQAAAAQGYTVTVVTDAVWQAMTAAEFGAYDLLIIGDPTCGGAPQQAAANAATWAPVVMGTDGGRTQPGNRIVIGTDPVFHAFDGVDGARATIIRDGIKFAGKQPGRTGLYFCSSCSGGGGNVLAALNMLSTGSGTWADDPGFGACTGNVSLIAFEPSFGPPDVLDTSDLSDWICSAHNVWLTFPTDWSALAVATDAPSQPHCGVDPNTLVSACGAAYILIAGSSIIVVSEEIEVSPIEATNPVGTTHTVTAHVTSDDSPVGGQLVTWTVTGQNAGAAGVCVPADCKTDANGDVSFTYTGSNGPGDDTIKASFTDASGALQAATAEKHWIEDQGPCTIECPENIEVGTDPEKCGAKVEFPAPLVSGNCTSGDRIVDADGTVSTGDGIPAYVEVKCGDPLLPFLTNPAGLDMFDNVADGDWTFGVNGDDLHVEDPSVCPTALREATHNLGLDCKVLDYDGSLLDGQPVSCDLPFIQPCPPKLKFHDANGNNQYDPGEDIVYDTNDDGIYDCGAVVCDPPSGSFFPVGVTTVTCTAGDQTCTFTVTVTTSFCGAKFYDADADGAWDDGEVGLGGWPIVLCDSEGNPIKSTVTGPDGSYCFSGLLPGTYYVKEAGPSESNWLPTTPPRQLVELECPAEVHPFGNLCLGAGGGKTLGFWSNKNGQALIGEDDLKMLRALNLVTKDGTAFDPTNKGDFRKWILDANAKNMAYMLSAQMAAMALNVYNGLVSADSLVYAPGCGNTGVGFNFITVGDLIAKANSVLGADGLTLDGDPNRALQECFKNALDNANNNKTFVQAEPCDYSFPE